MRRFIACMLVAGGSATFAAEPPRYRVVDLTEYFSQDTGVHLSNYGVVGTDLGVSRIRVRRADGSMVTFSGPDPQRTRNFFTVTGVSDNGRIVGVGDVDQVAPGQIWSRKLSGEYSYGPAGAQISSVNNAGYATLSGGRSIYKWNTDSGSIDLVVQLSTNTETTSRINNVGDVLISASATSYLVSGGVLTELAVPSGFQRALAQSLNDSGDSVGAYFTSGFRWIGATWNRDGSVAQTFDLGSNSLVTDINNSGVSLVGSFRSFGILDNNYLYKREWGMVDMTTLLDSPLPAPLSFMNEINDRNEILAITRPDSSNRTHLVLLTPVPEPVSLAILALGMIPLLRRRK